MTSAVVYKALLWKEWRAARGLYILTALSPLSLWLIPRDLRELVYGIALGSSALLGARLFAAEKAYRTARFEAERPVSRATVWNAKMTLSVIALAAEMALLFFVTHRMPFDFPKYAAFLLAVPASFSLCAFASVLFDRSIVALAFGFVLMVVCLMCGVHVLLRPGGRLFYENSAMIASAGIAAITPGALMLSRLIYVRWQKH